MIFHFKGSVVGFPFPLQLHHFEQIREKKGKPSRIPTPSNMESGEGGGRGTPGDLHFWFQFPYGWTRSPSSALLPVLGGTRLHNKFGTLVLTSLLEVSQNQLGSRTPPPHTGPFCLFW